MKKIFLFLVFACFYLEPMGQELIYFIQKSRYQPDMNKYSRIYNYDFIGHAYLDKNNAGIIDYNLLRNRIETLYPKKDASAIVVLNLENKIYLNLKSSNKDIRKASVNMFVELVKFVKNLRPNLQVGVYGIPFRFNYEFQKKVNYLEDFRPILKVVDFLAPDLYMSFGITEQSEKRYIQLVKENLDLFVASAKLENKPLRVFVWHKIHPYNKRFGGKYVDPKRMKVLVSVIKETQKNYRGLDGILWWDSWQSINQNSQKELTSIFLEYNSNDIK